MEKRLGNARLNGGGKEGNRWKKLRRREEWGSCDLRKTYAKLDFKFLGAIRRGLNYSKDRKTSCGWFFKKMQFFRGVMAPSSKEKKRRVKKSRWRSKSTVASPLYFKDILRFPRVILVMLANRNQQGTFWVGNDPGTAFLYPFDRHLVRGSSISFEFLSKVILSIEYCMNLRIIYLYKKILNIPLILNAIKRIYKTTP